MRQERDLNRESGNFGYAAGLSGRRGEAVTIAKEMEVKYAGAKRSECMSRLFMRELATEVAPLIG